MPDLTQIIQKLQLDPAAVQSVDTISEQHGHAIWRITMSENSYVLKWFPQSEASVEIESYLLLRKLGVPTLPLYAYSNQALLLEDLSRSERWRLAQEADISRTEVGQAVARWYQLFHSAGEALLAKGVYPAYLTRETDVLDPQTIRATGAALGLGTSGVWDLALMHIDLLKAALARLSVTLNYNDFHWTNLALSRQEGSHLEAIIYDYHLIGMGMRYSDCRNITGSLAGDAVRAFWDIYGEVDPREQILDRPLADLYCLREASRMSEFPPWAVDSREHVLNGDLEKDLRNAIELALSL